MAKIIPFGYSTSGAADRLDALMSDEQVMLVDIRESVKSIKKPEWSGDNLHTKYGRRYLWIQSLGNINYFRHGAPIKIRDLDAGLPRLVKGLERGYTLILLCSCARYESCHRRVVVEALQKVMSDVEVEQPDMTPEGMLPAISIRQPWLWLILNGSTLEECDIPPKIIENRLWETDYRGPLLLHAGKEVDEEMFNGKELRKYCLERWFGDAGLQLYEKMPRHKDDYQRGGIVGRCTLVDVVEWHESDWYVEDQYGFVLEHVESVPFFSLRGSLKLFWVPACRCCQYPVKEDEFEWTDKDESGKRYRLCKEVSTCYKRYCNYN